MNAEKAADTIKNAVSIIAVRPLEGDFDASPDAA